MLAATWSSAFAAKNAADMMAEAGLQPRRNHVIIMDEMHRALRASPLMVDASTCSPGSTASGASDRS